VFLGGFHKYLENQFLRLQEYILLGNDLSYLNKIFQTRVTLLEKERVLFYNSMLVVLGNFVLLSLLYRDIHAINYKIFLLALFPVTFINILNRFMGNVWSIYLVWIVIITAGLLKYSFFVSFYICIGIDWCFVYCI